MSSNWHDRGIAEFQMGNGTLLVTFTAWGEIDQIHAPHIDALHSKIGRTITSVLLPKREGDRPSVIPLDGHQFDIRLRLVSGCQTLQAEYHHKHSALRLNRTLGLHPAYPLMLDSWQILDGDAGLLHQSIPWIGHSTSAHCSLYHPTFNGLVHHRGRRWIGILARGEAQWVQVGHLSDDDRARLWNGARIDPPLNHDNLNGYPQGALKHGWDQVVQGTGTWGALASHVGKQVEFLIVCGESEAHLGDLLRQTEKIEATRFFQMIEGASARRHSPAAELLDRIHNPTIRTLSERSIDVLHALQDSNTGALIAAAEVDPHSRMSGGYGFSWPRDGAYLTAALDSFGFRERTEHYFEFLGNIQDPSGAWWQRYLTTGHAGPSWGRIQIDEPATVIASAWLHFRRTQDLFWLERAWPMIEKGLGFLEKFHSPEHPLGLPSHDLWEERMGIHAYSLGAVAAAFITGSRIAAELSYRTEEARYLEWGRALSAIISEKFVTADGKVRRSYIAGSWDYQRGHGYWDETPDVSLLGLIIPFGIYKSRDVAAQNIISHVKDSLWSPSVGGILRYPGDHYRGGNPWILTTLWLGIIELATGNIEEAKRCFDWSVSKSTPLGMLAEQVHRENGNPCWVIPLGWSHAMFLLFVRDVLDRKLEKQIW